MRNLPSFSIQCLQFYNFHWYISTNGKWTTTKDNTRKPSSLKEEYVRSNREKGKRIVKFLPRVRSFEYFRLFSLPLLANSCKLASASIGRAPLRIKNTRLCPLKKEREKGVVITELRAEMSIPIGWKGGSLPSPRPDSLPGKIIRWPRRWSNPWCRGARRTRGKISIKERIITSRARLRNCFVLCYNRTWEGRGVDAPLSPRDDYYCRHPSGLPPLL